MGFFTTSEPQDIVQQNTYINGTKTSQVVGDWSAFKQGLPQPVWTGHEDTLAAYWYAWKTALGNINHPGVENGFVDSYIDTAFNDCIFLWDSAFMTMFGKYARQQFNFENTLNNFYAKQHDDGFICRQIRRTDGADAFDKHDPASTGPNICAWTELRNFQYSGDTDRLSKVFIPILAYHRWLMKHRTWKDGSYWSNGWGCGMDNQPRQKNNPLSNNAHFDHGFLSWSEITVQQYISATALLNIAALIGYSGALDDIQEEVSLLKAIIGEKMWSDQRQFLFDLDRQGNQTKVQSIGAFWLLHTDILNEQQRSGLIGHLREGGIFNCYHPVPSLATNDEDFSSDGNYWCGGVWSPTNFMVFDGLRASGEHQLCHELALKHLKCVVNVYRDTGTLWENYSPDSDSHGNPAKGNFVGWTGLSTISIFIEHVLGIHVDNENKKIYWHIRLTQEHGIKNLSLKNGAKANLLSAARTSSDEKPDILMETDSDYELVVY